MTAPWKGAPFNAQFPMINEEFSVPSYRLMLSYKTVLNETFEYMPANSWMLEYQHWHSHNKSVRMQNQSHTQIALSNRIIGCKSWAKPSQQQKNV